MSSKILSIIVPSYNMEAYLPKCLGSLIIDDKELLQKLDVIVVNDGSKDRTSEIAHEFEARYPGVFRVVDKANGNYGSCVNAGLKIAVGTFVKMLDADDYFNAKEFCKLLCALIESEDKSEGVDLFLTDFMEVDGSDKARLSHTLPLPNSRIINVDEQVTIPMLYMHAIAYRAENLRLVGYLQTEGISYTDTEWTYYPIARVKRLKYEPFVVYRYLVGRAGQTIDPKVRKKAIWTYAVIADRMVKEFSRITESVPQVIKQYLENFAVMMCANVYNGAIIDLHNDADDQKLVAFDAKLKTISTAIYVKVMDRLESRAVGFNYGRYWCKYRTSSKAMLKMFRFYKCMTSLLTRRFR